jgi:NADPH2:quinone reductase
VAAGASPRRPPDPTHRGGATVIATVRHADQVGVALAAGAHHAVTVGTDTADRIRAIVPDGVDRVAELDLAG